MLLRRTWPFWRWLLAVTGGALLAVLALLLFYLTGGLKVVAPTLVLRGAELQLVSGQGGPTPAGLEIRQAAPQGWAVAQKPARLVRAERYRQFFWQVDGLQPGHELRLVWATLADPRTTHERALPPVGPDGGVLDLRTEPRWQGRIAAIGLAEHGALSEPMVVRRLELRPWPPTVGTLLRWMVTDWTLTEDWSQRSINYTSGAPLDALFPPVFMVALWVGLSAVLYALFSPPRRAPGVLTPYIALFLLGWLVLDLRWQWDLSQRLRQTADHFAGKSAEERRLAALDSELYRFTQEVRQRLPKQPARLFILSADPTGFWAGRARYHLLPQNSYAGFGRLPPRNKIRTGDYVLILTPFAGASFDPKRQLLQAQEEKLPVERVYATTLGALFRVRNG